MQHEQPTFDVSSNVPALETSKTVGRGVLGRGNAQRKYIPIEEWGGNVLIRQMSARQVSAVKELAGAAVDQAKQTVRDRGKLDRFGFAMICSSWINEDGTEVLTEADFTVLLDEPNAVIEKLTKEISEFNGMGDAATSNAKKNSDVTQNGASGTS